MRRFLQAVALAAFALVVAAVIGLLVLGYGSVGNTAVTAARFSELRADHTQLRAFLRAMPKGADLHVHLSGAVYAEDLIAWAAERGLCVRLPDVFFMPAPCDSNTPPVADVIARQSVYDDIVNALSMRFFVPSANTPSAHDQFFDSFSKYGAVTGLVPAEMTVRLLRRYAAELVQHTELMLSFLGAKDRVELAAAIKDHKDFAERLAILKERGLDNIVAQMIPQIAEIAGQVKAQLGCDTDKTRSGCGVSYRLIAQIVRNLDEAQVFVLTAFAAALVRAEPLVAGLNFVGPEDYRIAREDYTRHMEMIGFLTKKTATQREVPVALHAGELWIGLVPPDDLTFHIREAVETAGAKRVGHGVALAFERRVDELLAAMRMKKVAVEINLTSNDVILGVRGKAHPLMTYLAAKVPVVLSTDDAGVSRIDLTNEYFRAARDYPLDYRTLKDIARASIEHAFLDDAAKSKAFEELDEAFRKFEQDVVKKGTLLGNAWALIVSWFH